MAQTVKNLQEAVAALKRDPAQPVRARVDDLEVELRAVRGGAKVVGLGDRIAELFRRVDPEPNRFLCAGKSRFLGRPVRCAAWKFRHLRHERAIFFAPVNDDLVLIH